MSYKELKPQRLKRRNLLIRFFKIFIPIAFLIIIVSNAIYKNYQNSELKIIRINEKNRVALQIQSITTNLREAITDILIQNSHVAINEMMNYPPTHRNKKDYKKIESAIQQEYFEFVRIKKLYDQARIIDKNGHEIIRINNNRGNPAIVLKKDLQSKKNRYYFKEAIKLKKDEIYLSPFDLNIENGKVERPFKPMIRLATPLTDSKDSVHGIVVLNYLGERLLNDIESIEDNGFSQTMLLNSQGYWLKSKNKGDEWGFMFKDKLDITFEKRYPKVWEKMIPKESGYYQNDKGLFTFKRVYPIHVHHFKIEHSLKNHLKKDDDHWIALSFIPNEMLEEKFKEIKLATLITTILSLILFMFASFALAFYGENRKQLQNYQEQLIIELQEALDNIQVLSGLVPICSNCKSIRDDKGYWHILESYMEKHSDASFSHGLCPKCMKEIYGNEPWFNENDYKK